MSIFATLSEAFNLLYSVFTARLLNQIRFYDAVVKSGSFFTARLLNQAHLKAKELYFHTLL